MYFNQKIIAVIVLFCVYNVNSDGSCDFGKTPCYCERLDRIAKCYSNETAIFNHLNVSLSQKSDKNVKALLYSYFLGIPESLVLRKFTNLKVLTIKAVRNNKIQQFAFDSLFNLQYISVSHSNITKIEAKAFHNLSTLHWIHLHHNLIKEINVDAFYNLPEVEKLSLENNEITELRDGTFGKLKKLKKLYLMGNPLKKLQESLFGTNVVNFLTENSYLGFHTDSTDCFCDLFWLKEFYRTTKSILSKSNLRKNKCWHPWYYQEMPNVVSKERCLVSTTVLPEDTNVPTSTAGNLITGKPSTNSAIFNSLINDTNDDNITVNIPAMQNFFLINIIESAEEDN